MRRSRTALLPFAPVLRDEEDGTWMLTFSDLVLLLLAFVAIGILMERADGPHVIGRRLRAAPATPAAPEPFRLVGETIATDAIATDAETTRAEPPVEAPVVAPEPRPVDAGVSAVETARLRALARRLEMRLAAEGIAGLQPAIVAHAAVVVAVGDPSRGAAVTAAVTDVRPRLAPPAITVLGRDETGGAAASARQRALARTARVAHELVAGDPLLAVHVVTPPVAPDAAPARVEIRLITG